MSLSKNSRRNIADFNRACDMRYRVKLTTLLDSYIDAYRDVKSLEAEEAQLDAELGELSL